MSAASDVGRRLSEVEDRIDAACLRAGRRVEEVTLVGVSKMQPVQALDAAWQAGLRVFGENRVQEALVKAPQLPTEIDWHLIGPLQTNKVRKAVGLFSTIHSIDRLKIARAIDRVSAEEGVVRRGFLEVNIGGEASKHGFSPEQLTDSAVAVAALDHLEIVGLMVIPPWGVEPEISRGWFQQLALLRDDLARSGIFGDWPGYLSMGMSGDFEVAIEEGATHVRVGTGIFGPRVQGGA